MLPIHGGPWTALQAPKEPNIQKGEKALTQIDFEPSCPPRYSPGGPWAAKWGPKITQNNQKRPLNINCARRRSRYLIWGHLGGPFLRPSWSPRDGPSGPLTARRPTRQPREGPQEGPKSSCARRLWRDLISGRRGALFAPLETAMEGAARPKKVP